MSNLQMLIGTPEGNWPTEARLV